MRKIACLCLLVWSAVGALGECRPPQYQTGAIWVDSPSILAININIRLQDCAPSKLVCLAANLKRRNLRRDHITINIFSSHRAAQGSLVQQEYTKLDLEAYAQLHARYIFNADKHEDYVEIIPEGVDPSLRAGSSSTRIDLPGSGYASLSSRN